MNLQEMIQKYNDNSIILDEHEIKLSDILIDSKYINLLRFLSENQIIYSNDLKKLTQQEYDRMKVKLPNQPGIGDIRVDLYFKKMDEIRKNNNDAYYKKENITETGELVFSRLIGQIKTSPSYTIDLNILGYNDGSEYLDIRKVKNDGSRKNGVSIKKENINEFITILNKYYSMNFDNFDTINNQNKDDKNCEDNENCETQIYEDMFKELLVDDETNLKNRIIDNEQFLLTKLDKKFSLSIKLFTKKVESLPLDGDVYKFLKNDSLLDVKKELYDEIHRKGLKTAIDIISDVDPKKLSYTKISNLKPGDKVNTMTLCAIANNFNQMLGMYYNEDENIMLLKSQSMSGVYKNSWISNNEMLYFLQNEKNQKYKSLEFSHKPNQICRDIILNANDDTKVYLFDRNDKKDDYTFMGEYKPIKFSNKNKGIIIQKVE